MTDDEVRKLDQLFDRKLKPLQEAVSTTNKKVEEGFKSFSEELAGVNQRLDTVARHLENVDENLTSVDTRLTGVEKTQSEHSNQLERIERGLVRHGDRLDVLEAKTAHLPTPPRSR